MFPSLYGLSSGAFMAHLQSYRAPAIHLPLTLMFVLNSSLHREFRISLFGFQSAKYKSENQAKGDYTPVGLFCVCFVCEVLPYRSGKKTLVYIYLFLVSVKLLIGNKKWYHQSKFSCILFTVLNYV